MLYYFLFTLVFATLSVNALSCTQQWECTSVTTDYNYVACVDGVCACRDSLGFDGSATVDSKCSCNDPKEVTWKSSTPYCISFEDAVTYDKEQARNEILLSKVRAVYDSLLWPTPYTLISQLISGNTSGGVWDQFHPDAAGRVDPVGSFGNKDEIVEYFYGSVWTGTSQVSAVNITKLLVQGSNVTVRAILTFKNYDKWPGGSQIDEYLLTQSGVFSFTDDNLVLSAELIIHNLAWALGNKFDNQTLIRQKVCQYYFYAGCNSQNDPDGYYTDVADCVAFLDTLPFGTWDQNRANTVNCRYYHVALALARPSVHCPHVGKTGGDKCEDFPYSSYYLESY